MLLYQGQNRTEQMLLVHDIEQGQDVMYQHTFFIALICADPPTRDTDIPTLTAGRTPE